MTWDEVRYEIASFLDLRNGWDGFDADAPEKTTVAAALRLTWAMEEVGEPPPNTVIHGLDGTVIVIWRFDVGRIDIEIDDDYASAHIISQVHFKGDLIDLPPIGTPKSDLVKYGELAKDVIRRLRTPNT